MSFGKILTAVILLFIFTNFIFAYILVFLERRNPSATWAWLLVLLFLPGLGFILYLFLGQNLRKKRLFATKREEDELKRLAHRQENLLASDPQNWNHPSIAPFKDLIHLHYQNSQSVFTTNNRITILNNGHEKFPALIKCLEEARDHIHMEYYIIRDDEMGRRIRDILARKAREGVKVRLLYDGMGCLSLPKNYFDPILQAGGEVAEFYPPFFPYINVRVNYRNHRKITVIDGQKAFTGGLNLGDEYLGKSPSYGFWRDIHLLVEGNAVDSLQLRFMMDWQFASRKEIPYKPRYFPIKPKTGTTGVQVVSSGPDSQWASIRQGYFKMITRAEKSIYIETPYFVPDDSLAEALRVAALGGVDVRIMIPCKPDHPFVYWASTSYIRDLLEAGAKAYTYMNGFLHSKLVVVDGKVASVGTANLDIRSFNLNFEVNTFIYDGAITAHLEQTFLQDLKKCREITPQSYRQRPVSVRVKESVSRLLSPLL